MCSLSCFSVLGNEGNRYICISNFSTLSTMIIYEYSETCANSYLYSETTSIIIYEYSETCANSYLYSETTSIIIYEYSETCANSYLYSETTSIKRPLRDVPKVSAQYILTCIQRPPVYKGHYEVALAWPFNTGFTVP